MLVLSATGAGQKVGTRDGKAVIAAPDAGLKRLAELQQAQADALKSGNSELAASATRSMLEQALRILIQIRLAEGDRADGLALYQQLLALNGSAAVHLEYASALLRAGKATEAAQEAKTAAGLEQDNVSAWVIEGSSLRACGKERGAVVAFERALVLDQDVNIAYALASTYLALHDEAHAKQLFNQIFAVSGNVAIWHVAAGDAYREEKYLDQAVEQLKQALELDPLAPHAEFFLGLTYLQMNEWGPNSQSFEHLNNAVRMAPHEYVSNFYLGALESTDGSDLPLSDVHLRAAATADPSQPEVWLYLGLNANRERKPDLAEENLRKAIALTGDDDARNNYQIRRAYFALGRLLLTTGKREEGEAMLARYRQDEQAAVAASGSAIAAAELRDAGADMAGGFAEIAKPVAKPSEEATETKALASLSQKDKEQLRAEVANLRQLLADGFNDLGVAEARAQQFADAVDSFKRSESWQPPTPAMLRNLGVAAFRAADYVEAERALSLYLKTGDDLTKSDARATLILAFSEFSLDNFNGAAKAFGSARDSTLADDRATYSWAYSLARTGQMTEANKLADDLASKPLPPEVYTLVCHLFFETENYAGAIGCYRKALTRYADLSLAHFQIGEAMIRLDRPQEAVGEFEQELALTPGEPSVEYAEAFALLQIPAKEKARALLADLVAAHPEQAEAQYQLGKLLLEQNRTADAIGHLEQSERVDPTPDYIHYQLGTAYRKAGRTADSERELARYREIKESKRSSGLQSP